MSGNGVDGEVMSSLTDDTVKKSPESEEDGDETYSPEECMEKMRGDIYDMIALIEKIKAADPSIR